MRIFILFSFLIFGACAVAQPEDATIEIIDGKRYYIHFVQQGNTLYGIHRLYNVPVEDIVIANPGIEDGLSTGRRVMVPIPGKEGLAENLIIHVVSSKETLYGISKKYDTSIEILTELNPEISEGLREGQELKIPVKNGVGQAIETVDNPFSEEEDVERFKVSFEDTIIVHLVQSKETLYSISKRFMVTEKEIRDLNDMRNSRIRPGDELKIPIKKERITPVEVREIEKKTFRQFFDSLFLFKRKDEYKIAIVMPLFFDVENKEVVSALATEYYMGAQMALDSLEKMGLRANVKIIDSKNDSTKIKAALNDPSMVGTDLIFGPFYGDHAGLIAKWAYKNEARMICPFATNYKVLEGNPFVYNAVTSEMTLAASLGKYMAKDTSVNQSIVLVKPLKKKDTLIYDAFRKAYLDEVVDRVKPKLIETTLTEFKKFLKSDGTNRVVFLTNDKGDASGLINAINKTSVKWNDFDIHVYGTSDWVNFDNIPTKYKNKFQLHFTNAYRLNYADESMKKVHRAYRSMYNSDMSKMAVQGFDVTMHFCKTMLLNHDQCIGLMNDIEMVQKGSENGFENQHGYFMKFKDYEIVKVAEFHD